MSSPSFRVERSSCGSRFARLVIQQKASKDIFAGVFIGTVALIANCGAGMRKRSLGNSGLEVGPLPFGGSVFGWTADQRTSFRLLDAFVAAGFNLIGNQ